MSAWKTDVKTFLPPMKIYFRNTFFVMNPIRKKRVTGSWKHLYDWYVGNTKSFWIFKWSTGTKFTTRLQWSNKSSNLRDYSWNLYTNEYCDSHSLNFVEFKVIQITIKCYSKSLQQQRFAQLQVEYLATSSILDCTLVSAAWIFQLWNTLQRRLILKHVNTLLTL